MGEANEERVKDSRGGPASSPSDRHGREAGSGPAPYLQFQSAVLTAAATLGRGKGRGRGLFESGKIPADTSAVAAGVRSCRGRGAARMRPCPPPRSLESAARGVWALEGSAGAAPWGHMCFLAAAGAVQGGGGPAPGGRPGDGSRGTASSSFPGWGQGADSLALTAIGAFPGLLGLRSGCWLRVRAVPSFHAAAWGTRGALGPGQGVGLWRTGGLAAGVDGRVDSRPLGLGRPTTPSLV